VRKSDQTLATPRKYGERLRKERLVLPCAAGDAPDQGDEKRRVMERKGGTNPRKRKYTGGSQTVCPACGNFHHLEICYYTFPEKAPKWFRFRKETQDAADKALDENSQLKKEVTRLKSKRSKDSHVLKEELKEED